MEGQDSAPTSAMNSEAARRLTYFKWPRSECLFAQPENLAAAGFYLRPASSNPDRVACFSCGVCLVNWEPQDDPMQEHVHHGEKCDFVRRLDKMNVPFEKTRSALPMISWERIREEAGASVDASDLILGNLSPSCNWVAVAAPPLPNRKKPSIFLFDLNKVSQKPIEILLDLYASCMANSLSLEAEETSRRSGAAFGWLNSVDEMITAEGAPQSAVLDSSQSAPLCVVTSLCTNTAFDGKVEVGNESILAILCTAVAVDDAKLKKCKSYHWCFHIVSSTALHNGNAIEEVSTLNTMNAYSAPRIDDSAAEDQASVGRRPFILVHHVVEFPDEAVVEPLDFALAATSGEYCLRLSIAFKSPTKAWRWKGRRAPSTTTTPTTRILCGRRRRQWAPPPERETLSLCLCTTTRQRLRPWESSASGCPRNSTRLTTR